ncbi:MAG: hypothetical protein M1837_001635 [Sclerophora amabilis]|nr:MAG: hypothetical protein M1837_001635 [Sclerophora amabilis]
MSTLSSLPPASTFPTLPPTTQIQILDTLFEPSPALQSLLLPVLLPGGHDRKDTGTDTGTDAPQFQDYDALIDAVQGLLMGLLPPSSSSSSSSAVAPEEEDEGNKERRRLDREVLDSILGSHPRLGGSSGATRENENEELSALSREEQARMVSAGEHEHEDEGDEHEDVEERLRGLNEEYERVFPGEVPISLVLRERREGRER